MYGRLTNLTSLRPRHQGPGAPKAAPVDTPTSVARGQHACAANRSELQSNFSPRTPKLHRTPTGTRDQRARRFNNLENPAKSATLHLRFTSGRRLHFPQKSASLVRLRRKQPLVDGLKLAMRDRMAMVEGVDSPRVVRARASRGRRFSEPPPAVVLIRIKRRTDAAEPLQQHRPREDDGSHRGRPHLQITCSLRMERRPPDGS